MYGPNRNGQPRRYLVIITPPTMRELLEDPAYRSYVRKVPFIPANLRHGDPWQIWVRTIRGTWKTGQFPTYADAWKATVRRVKNDPDAADVCLVSKRVFYAPPGVWEDYKVRVTEQGKKPRIETRSRWVTTLTWDVGLDWCGRCRRPSRFIPLSERHHAIRKMAVMAAEDNLRCMFCGIRWVALPDQDKMRRIGG